MTIRSSGSPFGPAQGDRIAAAALEPLPALLTDERGNAAVLRMFQEGYPTVAEGLTVTGIRLANPPSDGAIADLAWHSPDGTARSVFTVGESYLSSPGTVGCSQRSTPGETDSRLCCCGGRFFMRSLISPVTTRPLDSGA
jgi:hypothetical protein